MDPAALGRLDGMFAFGIWSPALKRLMLARDAFGEKPLYIYESDRYLAFASEMQAFYALPDFDPAIDGEAIADYLMLGYLPGPATIYRRVRQLEPGSFAVLEIENGAARQVDGGCFFAFKASPAAGFAGLDRRVLRERLKGLLIASVEERLVADVPLGAFLSGGVDSSLIAAIASRELGRPLDTFSVVSPAARKASTRKQRPSLLISGHVITSTWSRRRNSPGSVSIANVLDQPNGDSSCLPTFLLSRFAREHVTVCLSGDGGDELFGGYGRYRDTLNDLSDPDRIRPRRDLIRQRPPRPISICP